MSDDRLTNVVGGRWLRDGQQHRIKPYDFRRPDKFSKDQIRTVSVMHETFARLASTALTAALRAPVALQVVSVDQMTFGELTQMVPNPAALAVAELDPLPGAALFELDATLSTAMVDRLLGWQGTPAEDAPERPRPLTPVDAALLEWLAPLLLAQLRAAWTRVAELTPRCGQIETNKQFVQIVPPNEMVVTVAFEVTIDGVRYRPAAEWQGGGEPIPLDALNLCIPYLTIEPVMHKLTPRYWYSAARRSQHAATLQDEVGEIPVSAELYYDGSTLTLAQVAALRLGSRVELPDYGDDVACLSVGGSPVVRLRADRNATTRGPGSTDISYRLEFDRHRAASGVDALLSGPYAGDSNKTRTAESAVRQLSDALTRQLGELSTSIAQMAARQEELSEQLAYATGGEPAVVPARADANPFDFLGEQDAASLFALLAKERSQAIAMVLAHVAAPVVVEVLERLAPDEQAGVVLRLARLSWLTPGVVECVAAVVRNGLREMASHERGAPSSGLPAVVDVLGLSRADTERELLARLDDLAPELAAQIKSRLFVFEDIGNFDDRSIAAVVERADAQDLVTALKTVDHDLRERVLGCVTGALGKSLRAQFAQLGRLRLPQVEAAQQRVSALVRAMEEQGELRVAQQADT